MSKVLTFKVEIKGLENKIWRKIEITDRRTIADLVYTILASFDSLAYHLYNVSYQNKRYESMVCGEEYNFDEEVVDANITILKNLNLQKNERLIMEYDFGSPTSFLITYLEERDLEKNNGRHYPYIIDGEGRGMIDDITDSDLKAIVNDIDNKGYSEYYFTPGYERTIKYDYRDYNNKTDNVLLKGLILEIKNGYEVCDR